ncbi:unnamed protein product [Coccothraustes coccothraustes]
MWPGRARLHVSHRRSGSAAGSAPHRDRPDATAQYGTALPARCASRGRGKGWAPLLSWAPQGPRPQGPAGILPVAPAGPRGAGGRGRVCGAERAAGLGARSGQWQADEGIEGSFVS